MDREDETVDVLTVEPVKGELENDRFRMPVLLDLDDSQSEEEVIAIGPGTMRRKSPGEGREWLNGVDSGESANEQVIETGSKRQKRSKVQR